MIRDLFMRSDASEDTQFRQRGKDVSRLESFSDAVFGFAITLLVVSLTPIGSFSGLMKIVDGLPAFGVEFAMIVSIWLLHYRFFRRYNLQDQYTVTLNILLLFIVLFYVYPLRFMFSVVAFSPSSTLPRDVITVSQVPQLFVIYGIGFVAVFLIFTLMQIHAYQQRKALDLNDIEIFDTQTGIIRTVASMAVGLVSILLAVTQVGLHTGLAGWAYFSLAPIHWLWGFWRARQRRSLPASQSVQGQG
jgi:uncharacterized membrane protein